MKQMPKSQATLIEGQMFRLAKSGQGKPSIVFISGTGGALDAWYKLYPEVEQLGTVFCYDRPGVGGSAKPREAQYAETVVAQLRQLLMVAEVKPPFVLVAHGFGALHANLFARAFADEVAGVLFIEPTTPEDVLELGQHQSWLQRRFFAMLDRVAPRDQFDEVRHQGETVKDIAEAPPFPMVPVVVLAGGKPVPRWLVPRVALRAKHDHQQALASISPLGKRVVAARSGYYPHLTEPDLVLDVLRQLLAQIDSPEDSGQIQNHPL